MDVPAPFAGTVSELQVSVGDRVSEGDVAAGARSRRCVRRRQPRPWPHLPPPDPAPAGHDADVVVIGGGIGGYTAAFRAADLGLRTILIERDERLGGVCLNVGCIPSKALLHAARVIAEAQEMADHGIEFGPPAIDLERLIAWKAGVVEKLTGGLAGMARARGVEVVRGEARFTGPHTLQAGESGAHASATA